MPRPSSYSSSTASGASAQNWFVVDFDSPVYVAELGKQRPRVVVCLGHGYVLSMTLTAAEDLPEAAANVVTQALQNPMEDVPAKPTQIVVSNAEWIPSIREVVPRDVKVQTGPLPDLTALQESLAEHLQRESEEDEAGVGYLQDGEIAAETVAGFLDAAARMYRTAPWTVVPSDGHLLQLDAPSLGLHRACMCVIGQMRQGLGFLVFSNHEEYRAFRKSGDARGGRKLTSNFFAVDFNKEEEVPDAMVQEVEDHGWPLAHEDAYPVVWCLDKDKVARPPSSQEVITAWVCCEALTRFMEQHAELFEEDNPEGVQEEYTLKDVPGKPVVTVTAPHPGTLDLWESSPRIGEGDGEDQDLEDEDQEEIAEFLDSLADQGLEEEQLDLAGRICSAFHGFGNIKQEDPFEPEMVEEFLLEFFPTHVAASAEMIKQVPTVLEDYFRWQGEEGFLTDQEVDALLERMGSLRKEFHKAAQDESRFSVFKKVALQMVRDGVDFSDPEAVGQYLMEHGQDPDVLVPDEGEPTPRKARKPAAAKGKKPATKRKAPAKSAKAVAKPAAKTRKSAAKKGASKSSVRHRR